MKPEKIAAGAAVAEKIPGWVERVLLPLLGDIRGEIEAVNERIDSSNERIDSLRNELVFRIDSTNERITSFDSKMDIKIDSLRNETKSEFTAMYYILDSLEKRIPVIEEMTALKLKIADLEKRLAEA